MMENIKFTFPIKRPHAGMPLANGQLGVLLWGTDKICLTVNRSDYWDHRFSEKYLGPHYQQLVELYDPDDVTPINEALIIKEYPFRCKDFFWPSTRLPCGRFELQLINNIKPEKTILDYDSGVVTVCCDGDKYIKFYLDLSVDVMLVEDKEFLIDYVSFVSAWEYVGETFTRVGIPKPEKIQTPTMIGEIQALLEDPSLASVCVKTQYGYAVTLQRGKNNRQALDNAKQITENTVLSETKEQNENWWSKYWQRQPVVNVPDQFFNKFFKFALYKFACASNPNGVACGLQGPWGEEYQRIPWSGDYHFNVNIQQIYTLAFATGNYEHLLPLFDMLESDDFQQVIRENAKNMFGIDDGLLLTHAVDDRGKQCGGIAAGVVLDFACGGWTAQLYWLYYQYTLDKKFLTQRALPFIRGVMRTFEEIIIDEGDKLAIPLSISAEYGCIFKVKRNGRFVSQNTGKSPSNQLSCAHLLADILLEASEIVGEKPKQIWHEIKQKLPHYTVVEKNGEKHIAIWEGQDLDVCHRHHSHLALIYPFDTLPEPTAEQQEIIDNTINHWIIRGMGQWSEWCYPWAAIIQARMGFKDAPVILLNLWKDIFINEGMAMSYLPNFQGISTHRHADMLKPREKNEIMQLDGTMAGATAIIEMLIHQSGDTVYLFKGIPDKWQDVSFNNIRLPRGFIINATRCRGKVTSLIVKSIFGGRIYLKIENSPIRELLFNAQQEQIVI